MLTRSQIDELAKINSIDSFTIFREYLQLLFLNELYQRRRASKIYFKGGTAIHLLLGSPRFSEDLDFSTEYEGEKLKKIIKEVEQSLQTMLPSTTIHVEHHGKESIRFRLKHQSPNFKYPFVIRIDLTKKEKPARTTNSPIETRFPLIIFPVVPHLSPEEILAEKVRALLIRGKGRDVFDLWFLLETGIQPEREVIETKLKKARKRLEKERLIEKIRKFPLKKLELDLKQFLPRSKRQIIESLRERLVQQLATKL